VRVITDLGGDDSGGGGNIGDNQTVVGENIANGHWELGNMEHPDLMVGDGDDAREGGTVDSGQLDDGHPGEGSGSRGVSWCTSWSPEWRCTRYWGWRLRG
jgi:hypothetical protein